MPEIVAGLRFRKSQARVLCNLADRVRGGELGNQHVEIFDKAAAAAAAGEPLVVYARDEVELHLLAGGFSQYGVVPPVIEDLNGGQR